MSAPYVVTRIQLAALFAIAFASGMLTAATVFVIAAPAWHHPAHDACTPAPVVGPTRPIV